MGTQESRPKALLLCHHVQRRARRQHFRLPVLSSDPKLSSSRSVGGSGRREDSAGRSPVAEGQLGTASELGLA